MLTSISPPSSADVIIYSLTSDMQPVTYGYLDHYYMYCYFLKCTIPITYVYLRIWTVSMYVHVLKFSIIARIKNQFKIQYNDLSERVHRQVR